MEQRAEKRERVSNKIINLNGVQDPFRQIANWNEERAVIGAVLQDPDLFPTLNDLLQPGDFYGLLHGYIWKAYENIANRSESIDIITVASELERIKAPETSDIFTELATLFAACATTENAAEYAKSIREAALRIRTLNAMEKIKAMAFDRATAIEEFRDKANKLLFDATDQTTEPQSTIYQAVNMYLDKIEGLRENNAQVGVPSCYKALDEKLCGFYPGEVTVLAGSEGMGKTTLLLSTIRNILRVGLPVVLFTLEMTQEEIIRNFIAMETGIPKSALKSLKLSNEQWVQFMAAAARVAEWPLHIIDEFPTLTPIQLRRKLRRLSVEQTIHLAVVDGLWLMNASEFSPEGRFRDVSNIMRDLTEIAKPEIGFNVPILITHQYRTEIKDRPQLYDLAESAGVRRNAQVILGMHRQSYYDDTTESPYTDLYILKDRNGTATGQRVQLLYNRDYSRYEDA